MKLIVLAVGQRMPEWADNAWSEFCKRFPPDMRLELKAVKAEARSGRTVQQCVKAEADRLLGACAKGSRRVVLDERGQGLSTAALCGRLEAWRLEGREVSFLIGGPDGLCAELRESADESLRLSELTLPHALVRVVLAEALYRAWTLHTGHPYHRE